MAGVPLWLLSSDPEMSAQAAALVLGVSTGTLREWAAAGRLEAVRTDGGQYRYLRASVANVALVSGPAAAAELGVDVADVIKLWRRRRLLVVRTPDHPRPRYLRADVTAVAAEVQRMREAGELLPASATVQPEVAAQQLGVSVRTLARWADEGRVRVVRLGRGRRYPAAEIAVLAALREVAG